MNKRAVFVLGPHRSGTSLVAAAIESLGFSLGNRSDWVNEDNPKGFFENSDGTPFNDRLLKFLDSRWDNPLFYGRRALAEQAPEDLEPWYQEAVEIVDRNFSSTDAWLVKDPRICVLLPFWHEVLRRAGYAQADVFHCYVSRNPVEAARSQQKRHHADPEFHFLGEELQESVALWYAYSLQALDEATDANNICVDYNEFLQDPRGQLGRLAEFLRADSRGPMTEGFLTKFVDTSLHRSHSTEDELRAVTKRAPFVAALYGSYQQLSGRPAFARDEAAALLGSEVSPRLWFEYSQALAHLYPRAYFLWQDEKELHRQLAGHFDNLKSVHENLQADYERLVEEIRLLEEAKYVVELNAERLRVNLDIAENDLLEDRNVNDELQKQLDALYSTTSWRWTWPLRFGSALARRDRKTVAEELTRAHGKITAFRSTVASRHPGLYRRVLNPLLNLAYNAFRVPLKKVYLAELEELAARGGVDPRAVGGADSAEFRGFQPSERFTKGMVDFEPKVTVIVPNYNHANYLRKRLDSIYGQTYGKFRVLLLDDCSSDDSREILSEYAERYPEITTTLFNKENSGNVFRQWARGIGAAESDIIWIAESDDYCDPDFLEKLVPFFRDEAVMLAYAHSVFVDEGDEPSAFTFEQYLSDLSVDKWQQTHVETAHNEVAKSLGQKNIIPNVSSAVFRKGGFDHLFEDEKWLGMKICGDWIFYLHLIRGGKIAYSADTNNYYRFHAANSSFKT